MLVNAGLVGEGVLAHHGLVARHVHAGDARDQPAGRVELAVSTPVDTPKVFSAGAQRHHHLFQRAVAGPLADAVDGALDLTGAGADRGEAVGHGHAQVVVAVHAQARPLDAVDVGSRR